jgi:ppGpp synthetase/RelA/SpoT-type nucleotidyltranferase
MDIEKLRDYLVANEPVLDRWGKYVQSSIQDLIESASVSIQMTSARVKKVDSAVGKVTRKGYTDPLNQMTDLVGVRFVVLLSPSLTAIGDLIESSTAWIAQKDKDPDDEAAANAKRFDYQSLHYTVRSSKALDLDGVTIPAGLPCEVQIRTLLQHAYAEVVHDSIYKAVGNVPPKAERFVARSMALIETTDHLFCETMRFLEEENRERNKLLNELSDIYAEKISEVVIGADEKLNLSVIDAYASLLPNDVATLISQFVDENPFIVNKVRARVLSDPFWSQPVALLAYWLVNSHELQAFERWPYASSHEALQAVYSDLGKSLR